MMLNLTIELSEAAMQAITLLQSLEIMAKGLVGIFAVFFVLWGFVALLNKLTAKSAQSKED
jgi:hypothetical protein